MTAFYLRTAIVAAAFTFAAAGSYAQTDTTKTDAQSAAAEAAKLLVQAKEQKVEAPKPDYWTKSLMTNLNFVQSTFSNWAKGGYNNYALSAYIDGNANWKKDHKYWNNRLQLDYGFLYSEDKPIMQKNKDRILLESTWGYNATKTISYTAKFTFLNQFSSGWTYPTPAVSKDMEPTKEDWKNARVLKSDHFAPAIATIGFGIDWVPGKWLTVNLAPVTGGITIVGTEKLRKNNGMIREKEYSDTDTYPDQKDESGYFTTGGYYNPHRIDFGAQLTFDSKIKINDNFEGSTHLILFSNYLKDPLNLRVNWDTRLMWKLNKFFSLNLTTNLIYDDTVLIVDVDYPNGHRAVQFTEALQFGFTYTFASKK